MFGSPVSNEKYREKIIWKMKRLEYLISTSLRDSNRGKREEARLLRTLAEIREENSEMNRKVHEMTLQLHDQTNGLIANMSMVSKRRSLETELAQMTAETTARKVGLKEMRALHRQELLEKANEIHELNVKYLSDERDAKAKAKKEIEEDMIFRKEELDPLFQKIEEQERALVELDFNHSRVAMDLERKNAVKVCEIELVINNNMAEIESQIEKKKKDKCKGYETFRARCGDAINILENEIAKVKKEISRAKRRISSEKRREERQLKKLAKESDSAKRVRLEKESEDRDNEEMDQLFRELDENDRRMVRRNSPWDIVGNEKMFGMKRTDAWAEKQARVSQSSKVGDPEPLSDPRAKSKFYQQLMPSPIEAVSEDSPDESPTKPSIEVGGGDGPISKTAVSE